MMALKSKTSYWIIQWSHFKFFSFLLVVVSPPRQLLYPSLLGLALLRLQHSSVNCPSQVLIIIISACCCPLLNIGLLNCFPVPPASIDFPQARRGRRSICQVARPCCAFPCVVSTPVSFCSIGRPIFTLRGLPITTSMLTNFVLLWISSYLIRET